MEAWDRQTLVSFVHRAARVVYFGLLAIFGLKARWQAKKIGAWGKRAVVGAGVTHQKYSFAAPANPPRGRV